MSQQFQGGEFYGHYEPGFLSVALVSRRNFLSTDRNEAGKELLPMKLLVIVSWPCVLLGSPLQRVWDFPRRWAFVNGINPGRNYKAQGLNTCFHL